MCESSEGNAEHLIYKCGKTDRLWKYISSIIMNCISLEFEIACYEHQEFIKMLLRHLVDGAYGRYVMSSIMKAKCFQMLSLYR